MRKIIYLLLVINFLLGSEFTLRSQELLKFTPYYISAEKIYYLDTLSIRVEPDAITLDHMIYFKEPIFLKNIKYPLSVQKSNITIDPVSIKYQLNWVRYYDIKDKLILNLDNEELLKEEYHSQVEPLLTDLMYEKLLGKVRDYLILGRLTPDIETGTVQNALSVLLKDSLEVEDGSAPEIRDSTNLFGEAEPIDDIEETENVVPQKDSLTQSPSVEEKKTPEGPLEYQIEKENNIEGMIFSDGTSYCFQVSSWKTEKKAVRLAQKLVKDGHNAFVVKISLPDMGVWFRIRIGFFNSLKETRKYISEMNIQ